MFFIFYCFRDTRHSYWHCFFDKANTISWSYTLFAKPLCGSVSVIFYDFSMKLWTLSFPIIKLWITQAVMITIFKGSITCHIVLCWIQTIRFTDAFSFLFVGNVDITFCLTDSSRFLGRQFVEETHSFDLSSGILCRTRVSSMVMKRYKILSKMWSVE